MKMTPRDALQFLLERAGMVMPMTVRDDNLSVEQIKLRNSVSVLRELIQEHEATTDDQEPSPYKRQIRDGKERIEKWKEDFQKHKLPPLSREDFIE